jgi:hypothetical protein
MEFNACDKANDFKGKKRTQDLLDYVHQAGSVGSPDCDVICGKSEMRETGKFCKIYCHATQKKWPGLTPE